MCGQTAAPEHPDIAADANRDTQMPNNPYTMLGRNGFSEEPYPRPPDQT